MSPTPSSSTVLVLSHKHLFCVYCIVFFLKGIQCPFFFYRIMKTRKINFLGEDLNIAFNLAVMVAFEQISEKPFDNAILKTTKGQLILYTAVILANNPDTKITMERLMTEPNAIDIQRLDKEVAGAMKDYYVIEPQDKEGEDEKSEGSNPFDSPSDV